MDLKKHRGFTVVQAVVGPKGGVKSIMRAHPMASRAAAEEMLALLQKHEPGRQFFMLELVEEKG